MRIRVRRGGLIAVWVLVPLLVAGVAWKARSAPAGPTVGSDPALEMSFEEQARPFLAKHCLPCHSADTAMSGVRVDELNGRLEEHHLRLWGVVRSRISDGSMPPEGAPQPSPEERGRMAEWIGRALDVARSRPDLKNGLVRRLTVAQYRNSLRELLHLEDDLTDTLPPDAVSKDGFVNNAATLDLSPLQMEAYLDIAGEALDRAIVNPDARPAIQSFRVDLGKSINPDALDEQLILGANSQLLENADYVVTEPALKKPFAFHADPVRTKFRFIEGYKGNATVRGWRDFDSIYHAIFAGMRGSRGYPKGNPFDLIAEGLLLRPAIPNDAIFRLDGTYGPKANFKVSVRQLPDEGRFRVTVTAAKYPDGLLLNPGIRPRDPLGPSVLVLHSPGPESTLLIPQAGIYQVDAYEAGGQRAMPAPDAMRLRDGLFGPWPDESAPPRLMRGGATLVGSPLGTAVSLMGDDAAAVIEADDIPDVGEGDFTVAAWIFPRQRRAAGIVSRGGHEYTHGWFLDLADNRGTLRFETTGPDRESNGRLLSPQGVVRAKSWQHVSAIVRREGQSTLYVNGYAVAKGEIGPDDLDNAEISLQLGRVADALPLVGSVADARVYRRAISEAELQALLENGREFAVPPPDQPRSLTLRLGSREFSGLLQQPAFLAVRLSNGPLRLNADYAGVRALDKLVLTPLAADDPTAAAFRAFERRSPLLGVHLGLRRDCGSTLAPVGSPFAVSSLTPSRFVFDGAIRDFPSPDVEKDNVNYLAGIREIGVRSEYTDGRDMPRLLVHSVQFEGPYYEVWPPKTHTAIFADSDHKSNTQAYARQILASFATRAYRRPASDGEVAALMDVFHGSLRSGAGFRGSIKDALQVTLTSPQFLFLAERSETPDAEPLDGFELASKLSYFLWNGPPDRQLLDLASSSLLRDRLEAQVRRMVRDRRFGRFLDEFAAQWLSLGRFDVLEPDRERFPDLTTHVRTQLRREPVHFVGFLMRENLPVRNLIRSDFLVANEVVASYYGLDEGPDSGFGFVPVTHARPELGGLLSQAAIMAGLSDGRESNPVKRGAWLARKIVAEPPDDPPPNVPDLDESTEGLPLRERLERHRSMPGCVQCHLKIDPWGVALEQFDASGRLKREPVDAASTLPDGSSVDGIEGLRRYLSEERVDQVAFSVLKHLATYAVGRDLTFNEIDYLKTDGFRLKAGGYRMQDMLRYVVGSKLFLEK
ncbi:MAG: DUF1592 domain-containing protein [Bryobacterales bacterium]|nr:DUF1592 domain-containing protein [Bryobacterales bacterium]